MGQYANVNSKQLIRLVKWLGNHKNIDVLTGGKHPTKVTCVNTGQTFPLPAGHRVMNKNIVKAFKDWLVKNNVCSEEEFNEHL